MAQSFHNYPETTCFSQGMVSEFDVNNDNNLDAAELRRNLMRKLSFRESLGEIPNECLDDNHDAFSEIFQQSRKMTNENLLPDQMSTKAHSVYESEPYSDSQSIFPDSLSQQARMSLLTPPKYNFDTSLYPQQSQAVVQTAINEDRMEEEFQPEITLPHELRRETSLLDHFNGFDQVPLHCKDTLDSMRPHLKLNIDFGSNFRLTDSPNSCLMVKSHSEKPSFRFESPGKRYNNSSLNTCKNLRDPDLRTITPETLIELIRNPQDKKFLVIDCRYPYEYQGGHVKDAINITTPEDLEELLIKNRHLLCKEDSLGQIKRDWKGTLLRARLRPHEESPPEEVPPILIFHCEFSQKRGPRALRKLRTLDRDMNYANWPNLFYPEVYVLENGYKNFHTKFPEHCNPVNQYIRMVDKAYKPMYVEAKAHDRKVWKKKRESSQDDSPISIVPLHRFKTMSCI